MGRNDCEQARDLLPLLIRGQLLPAETVATETHLAECGDCAEEAAVVRALARSAVAVPAALEARVLLAVRRPVRRGGSATRLAMAATVAAAVLGGSVVFERWAAERASDRNGGALVLEDGLPPVVSWGVAHDPLLQSGSSLSQLTVEQLELILEELDS